MGEQGMLYIPHFTFGHFQQNYKKIVVGCLKMGARFQGGAITSPYTLTLHQTNVPSHKNL